MTVDIHLLELLSDGRFHSGTQLSNALSVTRAAIWKKINALKRSGIDIYAVKGKGYRLSHTLELLQQEEIRTALPASVQRHLRYLTVLHEIDSTNSYLLSLINHENFHSHAVLAEFQSAGRGRRASHWVSPFAAGLCLSFAWHYPGPVESISLVSLATGVAVMRALQSLAIEDAGLKWPNDIYWNGRKLGGILVEMRMESAGPCNVVVGVGLNYSIPAGPAQLIDHPWVDIVTIKNSYPSRNQLAARLITEIAHMLVKLETHPANDIITSWRQYDCMHGKEANLILPDRQLHGRVKGIDDDGALLFAVGNSAPRRFHAGEISLRGVS